MNTRHYRFLSVIWAAAVTLMLLPGTVYAFSAEARVDRTRISMAETILLQVVAQGGEAEVDLSSLKDFQVLSASTQTSRSYTNGTWTHEVTYQYHLAPVKTGVLTIPPLTVTGDDGTVATQEIQVLCSETPTDENPGQGFSARAELDTDQAVIGQQVVYTLRLFVSPERFAGASFDPPGFKGLDVRELTKWKKYTRTIEGRAVGVNEIQFLIQGRTPGAFDIAPALFTVQEAVQQPRQQRSRDPFDSFFNESFFNQVRTRPVRVLSNSVSLTFTPLPPYTGQETFSGLVGEFTIGTKLDKAQVRVGDSATLTITVQGRGNIMDLGELAPALDPEQFKIYPDAPVEDIRATDQGMAGKKVFSVALVPKRPGSTRIPALSLTYYHTGEKAYKTVTAPALELDVLGAQAQEEMAGSVTTAPAPGSGQAVEKQGITLINRDIMEIREDISALTHVSALPAQWFAFWMLMPGFLFGLFLLIRGRQVREPGIRESGMKKARALLKEAEQVGPGHDAFTALVQGSLNALVLARAEKRGESLTRQEARDLLTASDTDPETVDQVLQVMDRLDMARFGGRSLEQAEGADCLRQVRLWMKTLALVLFAGLLLAPGPKTGHASEPAAIFVDAVRDYKAGRFEAAAQGFEIIAGSGVVNPYLCYNIGNAHLRAGSLGKAVLWYERAARLSPENPDIRFNLSHARSLVRDRIESPLTLRDILFFWEGLVSLKHLQMAAIAGSALFFLWAGIAAGRKKRILSPVGLSMLALLVALTLVAGLEAYRLGAERHAVILAEQTRARSGTLETATPLFELHEGTKVRVLEKKGGFIKIRIEGSVSGDKMGWVSLDHAEVI